MRIEKLNNMSQNQQDRFKDPWNKFFLFKEFKKLTKSDVKEATTLSVAKRQ